MMNYGGDMSPPDNPNCELDLYSQMDAAATQKAKHANRVLDRKMESHEKILSKNKQLREQDLKRERKIVKQELENIKLKTPSLSQLDKINIFEARTYKNKRKSSE